MKRTIVALSLTVAAAVALGSFAIPSVGAAEKEYKSKAKATELIQEPLPGVAGKKVIIKQFALPPGFVGESISIPVRFTSMSWKVRSPLRRKGEGPKRSRRAGCTKSPWAERCGPGT